MSAARLSDRDLWLVVWALLVGGKEDPAGSNAGVFVERILASVPGLKKGDAWCMATVSRLGRALFGRAWPLPNTGSCDNAYEAARKLGRVSTTPSVGALFFIMHGAWDARHVGAVRALGAAGAFETAEGNAAPMARQSTREGTEIAERTRGGADDHNAYLFVELFDAAGALLPAARAAA